MQANLNYLDDLSLNLLIFHYCDAKYNKKLDKKLTKKIACNFRDLRLANGKRAE